MPSRALVNPYVLPDHRCCAASTSILAVSLNLVNGFTGQFSIGHAGFMAVGAYASADVHAARRPGLRSRRWPRRACPPVVAQGAALLVGARSSAGSLAARRRAALVGLPSLRLRGDYLAIVTLGFGEIIRVVILNVDAIGGARGLLGHPGVDEPLLGRRSGSWSVVVRVAPPARISTHGRALFAIREDEIAAEAMGVDTTRYKVLAFVLGAFFAGVAGGAVRALRRATSIPSSFTFLQDRSRSSSWSCSAAWAASRARSSPRSCSRCCPRCCARCKDYRMVIYALLLIVLMIARPQGLLGHARDLLAVAAQAGRARRESGPRHERRRSLALDHVSMQFGGLKAVSRPRCLDDRARASWSA